MSGADRDAKEALAKDFADLNIAEDFVRDAKKAAAEGVTLRAREATRCAISYLNTFASRRGGTGCTSDAERALMLIVLDPRNRERLRSNDPQALKQAEAALTASGCIEKCASCDGRGVQERGRYAPAFPVVLPKCADCAGNGVRLTAQALAADAPIDTANDMTNIPAAACTRCGGWTPMGGMSHWAMCADKVMGRTGCTCEGAAKRETEAEIRARLFGTSK